MQHRADLSVSQVHMHLHGCSCHMLMPTTLVVMNLLRTPYPPSTPCRPRHCRARPVHRALRSHPAVAQQRPHRLGAQLRHAARAHPRVPVSVVPCSVSVLLWLPPAACQPPAGQWWQACKASSPPVHPSARFPTTPAAAPLVPELPCLHHRHLTLVRPAATRARSLSTGSTGSCWAWRPTTTTSPSSKRCCVGWGV